MGYPNLVLAVNAPFVVRALLGLRVKALKHFWPRKPFCSQAAASLRHRSEVPVPYQFAAGGMPNCARAWIISLSS